MSAHRLVKHAKWIAPIFGVLTILISPRSARALEACTAAEVVAQSGSTCPTTDDPCTLVKQFTIYSGCELDFGSRDVTVTGAGELRLVGSGTVRILAGSFTVGPSGFIDGRGTTLAAPDATSLTIDTTGAVAVLRSAAGTGRIDLSGRGLAGALTIRAGGSITVGGRIDADATIATGGGGSIFAVAGGDFVALAGSSLSATGGDATYGDIDLAADGAVLLLGDPIAVNGDDGGVLEISAGGDVVLNGANASASGDADDGGTVSVAAGGGIQVTQPIRANGSSGTSGGGGGGSIILDAGFGDVVLIQDLLTEGAGSDGAGGEIGVSAAGSVDLRSTAVVSARANGPGDGGTISIVAGNAVSFANRLDASGGTAGGEIAVGATGDVTVLAHLDASGRSSGFDGGSVDLTAGLDGQGTALIGAGGFVDAGGGGCSAEDGCGWGGDISLTGCDVTVSSNGRVLARAYDSGGLIELVAHERLTVSGDVDASFSSGGTSQGATLLRYPSRKPAILTPGAVQPVPSIDAAATCTAAGQESPGGCLDPCPTCGDGLVEFPETCDQAGPPVGCDGCSRTCRLENCVDGNRCTTDSCDPILGCSHAIRPDGAACDDADACNGSEVCGGGTCRARPPLDCSDGNPCTIDSCDPATGCSATHPPEPASTPCSDGNLCTAFDVCDGTGHCVGGGPVTCSDGMECTDDGCDPGTGCLFTNRTGSCGDDGDSCTADLCGGGQCTHPPLADDASCEDGTFCTVGDTCRSGVCQAGRPRSCVDVNACTQDRCDESLRTCVHAPIAACCGNGVIESEEECDDGNADDDDACPTSCRLARCGDGFVLQGEEFCDLGPANSNAPDASCRLDCRPQDCGDGIVDVGHGEQCDDANPTAGDGCSPQCFEEPPVGRIAGGGSKTTDCLLEFALDKHPLDLARSGRPNVKQKCRDGDPTCDRGSNPGECVFRVWLCARLNDPLLPACAPQGIGPVVETRVLKPSSADATRRVEDAETRQSLVGAATSFSGALEECGPRFEVRVPLNSKGRTGHKVIKLKVRAATGKVDPDTLKLDCLP